MSACYRSNHPDVLAVWEDTQRRYRETHERIAALKAKYGATGALVTKGSSYDLGALLFDEAPPESAWRYDRKIGGWLPRRSVKEGKPIGKEFDACRSGRLGDVPGLPHYVQVVDGAHPFQMSGPTLICHDGYVWACWSQVDHEDVLKSGWGSLDEALWEQIKRSEYETAKEAMAEVAAT